MALACFRAASLLTVTAGLGLGAGCIIEDDPELATTEQGIGDACGWNKCGTNGPELSERAFHELNEAGQANAEGFKLDGIYFSGVKWKVDVVNDQLKARFGIFVKTGINVKNGVIKVVGDDGTAYSIKITDVAQPNLYPWGPVVGPSGTTWAYELRWTGGTQKEPINLCSNPDSVLGSEEEGLGVSAYSALLFEGERYNGEKLLIRDDVPVENWFNIACNGHILSKLALTHHTKVTSTGAYVTTPDERQTMIRMFAADYCGTGHAFTVGGYPLSWTDDHGWLPHVYLPNHPIKLEARWSPHGATCLETPRLTGTTHPEALAAFGATVATDIVDMIGHECELPPLCSDIESDDPLKNEGKHLVSANPEL